MIPFLSKYRQQYQYEKIYWLTKAEKRRFIRHICALALCIGIILYLWLR